MDSQLYRNTNTSYDLLQRYHEEKAKRDLCIKKLLSIDHHKYFENAIALQNVIAALNNNMNNIQSVWNDIENDKNLRIKENDTKDFFQRCSETLEQSEEYRQEEHSLPDNTN